MIVWTPAAWRVLSACVLYFCVCTCSAQLSIFHMEKRSLSLLFLLNVGGVFVGNCFHKCLLVVSAM